VNLNFANSRNQRLCHEIYVHAIRYKNQCHALQFFKYMITTEYVITALIMALLPGTGVVFTIGTGLIRKTKYGIVAAIGCTFGIIPHMIACILGLSAIMQFSAELFATIKYAGVAYLCYLAVMTWKNAGSNMKEPDTYGGYISIVRKGILINLLNPKLTIFFLSFLPQYLPSDVTNASMNMVALSLVFMLATFVVFVGYAVAAGAVSSFVQKNKSSMRWLERGFAGVFAAFAVKLALQNK